MVHASPRRVRPPVRVFISLAVLGLVASILTPGGAPGASSIETDLQGQIPNAPPYASGFPIPFFQTVDYRPRQGSVVAADIDRDGRRDLVVSIPNGQIVVVRPDGTRMAGWPRTFDDLPQPAFPAGDPAIGDLDGDGSPEIVTCVVSGTPMRRNFLYALRADGSELRQVDPAGLPLAWPVEMRSAGSDYYTCSGVPTLMADLTGDGIPEVIRGMNRGTILAFKADGTPLPGWPLRLGPDREGRLREVNADMATADLDGDGRMELIFVESGVAPRLAVVSGDGRILPGFPKWLTEIVDQQAPVPADLDGDGRPELVQSTLPFQGDVTEPIPEPSAGGPLVPAAVHVIRSDGSSLPGWPRLLEAGAPWGAVVTDLNFDGLQDILQQDGDQLFGFDEDGSVLQGFPVVVHRGFVRSQFLEATPWVVADLNGDRRPDLLQAMSNQYAGSSYLRIFGLRAMGQPIRGFPFDAPGLLAASRPVLTDLNGDGFNDLVILGANGGNGGWSLAAWDLGAFLLHGRR
ncbi:MAG: VCBS repeat-containing protein [Acidobacteria bacterium]|nr:VCBS repeat-containing protein [Acidobacteriota bacterium]